MDNALLASAPSESARKRRRRVPPLLRLTSIRSPDPRPTPVLSQSPKPKAVSSAAAKRLPEKVPSPSAPVGSPSRPPASQLQPKRSPFKQPQPVSNGSQSTEHNPAPELAPSLAQSSAPHPRPSDSSVETPAGQRIPQSPPDDVILNPKKRVRDTAAGSPGKGSAHSEERPQQALKRVKLEGDDSPRALPQGSASSKEPHSSGNGRAGRRDSGAHASTDKSSSPPNAEGARPSLPVGRNERPSLKGVSHIDGEPRRTSNDVTAAQAVSLSRASSAVDARRNTNSADGTQRPSPRADASTSEAVPRTSLSRTERQGSCRPDSGGQSASLDNAAVGTPLSNGQSNAIRTDPSQASVATQTERPDQIAPAEQQHATLEGIDPDVTRYTETLGLPPDIYASKLEAIGLKNGAIINATRNFISEDRKDKLEQELQKLCGLSVVESMVLISGLRQVRTA
ncbi:hypothetical protein DAEQUDRAFT_464312 [Daedalea quercina L-15889]|uniref:Uncharacterized protein n=1 Tax=Daedalea quercina L-15889 TaxID=1314783 RepID=A0A165TEN2_9APHY|nr:hypothetical protein DAEQUDRAFT_464312 [Daedalea quercina L-15889]